MNNDKMVKLQHFFQVDMEIKKRMYKLAPNVLESQDDESFKEYVYNFYEALNYVFTELKCVAVDFLNQEPMVLSHITSLEQHIKNEFQKARFDYKKMLVFYLNYISNLSLDFQNSVKRECVGYSNGELSSIKKAKTVNEVLHFLHSYIINNENILQALPILGEKQNEFGYPIKLRGQKEKLFSHFFTHLFAQFPKNIDVGTTDMVTINDKKLIMMVRDRGHALTIEISLYNDRANIQYFIPKICNLDMVNALPGINKINENSVGATGTMDIEKKDLSKVLFDFISKVPMDSDMFKQY